MNWEVEFTDQARQDLRDILDYITYELQEPKVAVNLVRQITKEILSLNQMPMRYRLYDEEPWQSQGLRCFPVKNYLILLPGRNQKHGLCRACDLWWTGHQPSTERNRNDLNSTQREHLSTDRCFSFAHFEGV